MVDTFSDQEKFLTSFYDQPIDKWFKMKKINISSAKEISKKIVNYLYQQLNIQNEFNLDNFLRFIDRSYLDLNKDYGINKLTEILYDIPGEILHSYYSLCEEILNDYKDHLIQRQPTIRVHYQDEESYQFYPFWHSDPILGHPPFEKNIWIPLTEPNEKKMHGFKVSNPEASAKIFKIFCKSSPYLSKNNNNLVKNKMLDKESEHIDCKLGEGVIFDARLFHSAIPYKGSPRISIDIRIMHKKFLCNPYPIFRGLGRKKVKFDSRNFFISLDEINLKKKFLEN